MLLRVLEVEEFTLQSCGPFRKLVQDQMHKVPGCPSQQRQPHLPGTGWQRVSVWYSKTFSSLEQFRWLYICVIPKTKFIKTYTGIHYFFVNLEKKHWVSYLLHCLGIEIIILNQTHTSCHHLLSMPFYSIRWICSKTKSRWHPNLIFFIPHMCHQTSYLSMVQSRQEMYI